MNTDQARLENAENVIATHEAFRQDERVQIFRTRIQMDKQRDYNNRRAASELAKRGGLFDDVQ